MTDIAGAYRRVSTLEQSRGFSPEAQKTDIARLADQMEVVLEYDWEDADSGAEWDLPGLNAMLTAAREGKFNVLLLTDPDRLARNFVKQLVIEEELRKLGVKIRYVNLKVDDTPEGRLMTNMRASFSEYEREKIRMRTSRGRRAKMEQGMIVGTGYAPYGYAYTHDASGRVIGLAPDPTEAPIVKELFARLVNTSLDKTVDWLTARGVPIPKHGRQWHDSTLRAIVTNPIYLGTYTYSSVDFPVEPLVTPEQFERTQRALLFRRKTHGRKAKGPEKFALRGRLRCGHCGGVLSAMTTSRVTQRYYFCLRHQQRTCELKNLEASTTEAHIWREVTSRLRDQGWLKQVRDVLLAERASSTRTVEIITDELTRLRARLNRVVMERLNADPNGEMERIYREAEHTLKLRITPLVAELRERERLQQSLPSDEDIDGLLQRAELLDEELDIFTPGRQRQTYNLLEFLGTVRNGTSVALGRNSFDLSYSALIPFSDDAHSLLQLCASW